MRDQVRAAERFGVRAARIDSTNSDEWDEILDSLAGGEIDLPERLAASSFQADLAELLKRISLLVIDEAHCISDWGHDFRPDYRRIAQLVHRIEPSVPVLATTATATSIVANDVADQLGGSVEIQRGPLARASLRLQALELPSEYERMAWLAQHLPDIDGSGIIYVLTKAHASRVAGFLRECGVDADHYTGGGAPGAREDKRKIALEQRLLANEVKAVVATPALGMGFDKPDLAFVAHLQMPQSLIHYYQQVGRAGRAMDESLGMLLHGEGDQRITDYFIAQAFPPVGAFTSVLGAVRAAYPIGASTTEIAKRAMVGRALTERVLGQLAVTVPPPVERRGARWYATNAPFELDVTHMAQLTARRRAEYEQMQAYARGEQCLMAFIARALDDPEAADCGRCAVCVGRDLVPRVVRPDLVDAAANFKTAAAPRKRRRRPPKTTARVKRRRRRP
jgi:ATP-dependent DNA helicase RecQ